MAEPISLRTRLTIDDALAVGKFMRNQSWFFRNDILVTSGIVFFGFVLVIVSMAYDSSEINIIGTLLFSGLAAFLTGALVAIYHRLVIPWFARRNSRQVSQIVARSK